MRFLCLELHRAARRTSAHAHLHKRILSRSPYHATVQQACRCYTHPSSNGGHFLYAGQWCPTQLVQRPSAHTRARATHITHSSHITHHTSHTRVADFSLHRIPRDLSPTSHIALLIRALCRGKAGPKKEEYTCELALFGDIDVEKSKRLVNPHQVFLTLAKKEDGYWPRVTKEKTKV
jgi:hypothetical protein